MRIDAITILGIASLLIGIAFAAVAAFSGPLMPTGPWPYYGLAGFCGLISLAGLVPISRPVTGRLLGVTVFAACVEYLVTSLGTPWILGALAAMAAFGIPAAYATVTGTLPAWIAFSQPAYVPPPLPDWIDLTAPLDALPDARFAAVRAYESGWQGELPATCGTFLKHSVAISFQTRSTFDADPPPLPTPDQVSLALMILELPEIFVDAEQRFLEYTKQEPTDRAQVMNPVVWISDEVQRAQGFTRWTLVIHRHDCPDFGYHVEFDGAKFLEIYSGD